MSLTRTSNFGDIPLYYDRYNNSSYGKNAQSYRPYIDEELLANCHSCFKNMQDIFSQKGHKIEQIWSGGVERKDEDSLHYTNKAFDLDGLVFEKDNLWIADSFPTRPNLYLAIEACLRMYFGIVLTFDYDVKHKDHIHFDNDIPVEFKKSRTYTLFLQHSMSKIHNQDIGTHGVDGIFGSDTMHALHAVKQKLQIGEFSQQGNWLKYLELTANSALDIAE